ncbi:MAG: hypothetical protein WC450_12985 [Candidatus Omnitrophota bacterium]|jgi:hypothetical protein
MTETTIMTEFFICEKYHCRLTRQGCAARRAARTAHASSGRKYPTYPGCQDCAQGETMAAGISTSHIVATYPGQKYKPKQEGTNMAYPNKIDHEKLKTMIADGKSTVEIAKEFGVMASSIRMAAKRFGLKTNSSRKHRGVAAKPSPASAPAPAPVREAAVDATYKRFSPPLPSKDNAMAEDITPVRIIPVTLRLTVEVNVRVSAQGCN